MNRIPGDIDRLAVAFDEESLVSDAGLLAVGTLMSRLGLEGLLDETVRMGGRVGGSRPGRKILSLVVLAISEIPQSRSLKFLTPWG